jgi:hypothetical protein
MIFTFNAMRYDAINNCVWILDWVSDIVVQPSDGVPLSFSILLTNSTLLACSLNPNA